MFEMLLALFLAVPAPAASEIVRRSDRAVLGENAAYTLRMTVERPGKPQRVVEMKGWKKGDDKGLVRYTAPPKERGTAYLRDADNTWLYIPSGEKVVRVGAQAELRRRRLQQRRHLPPVAHQRLRAGPGRRGRAGRLRVLQAGTEGEGPHGRLRPRGLVDPHRRYFLPGAHRVLHDRRQETQVAHACRAEAAGHARAADAPGDGERRSSPALPPSCCSSPSTTRRALTTACSRRARWSGGSEEQRRSCPRRAAGRIRPRPRACGGARCRTGVRELSLPHGRNAAQSRQRAWAARSRRPAAADGWRAPVVAQRPLRRPRLMSRSASAATPK